MMTAVALVGSASVQEANNIRRIIEAGSHLFSAIQHHAHLVLKALAATEHLRDRSIKPSTAT